MTNQSSNSSPSGQPLKEDVRGVYNPITQEDLEYVHSGFFKDLDTPSAKLTGLFLFALLFFLSNNFFFEAPLIILILFGCVLYRMSGRERRIATLPLGFATLRLATALASELPYWTPTADIARATQAGLPWLPLFLAASLFYSPWKLSHTSRMIFWESLIYLLTGFLNVDAFLFVSTLLHYVMFIGLVITLILDLAPNWSNAGTPQPAPLAQPAHS